MASSNVTDSVKATGTVATHAAETDPLTLQTVAAINELYRRTDELYHEVAKRAGFADCAFEILYSLMERDGLTQKQLCGTSFSTKQTVSSSIKRLQADGLVEVDGTGKGCIVRLTAAGRHAVEERIAPVLAAECAAVEVFAPQQKQHIIAAAKRFTDSLAAQFEALRF